MIPAARCRRPVAALVALGCAAALLGAGCGTGATQYAPQVLARGELVLRYDEGFEMWAGGRRVARSLSWRGLPEYVACVPAAHDQARKAVRAGTAAVTLSILGGTLGAVSVAGLAGLALRDQGPNGDSISSTGWALLGGGVGLAVLGTFLAGFGRLNRNAANGHAVDALNYYNDAVGSLGATCDDLRYPPSAGPSPPGPGPGPAAPPAAPPPPLAPPPAVP